MLYELSCAACSILSLDGSKKGKMPDRVTFYKVPSGISGDTPGERGQIRALDSPSFDDLVLCDLFLLALSVINFEPKTST